MDFRLAGFRRAWLFSKHNGRSKLARQPWNVEAASCLDLFTTYVWWKTEASSGAIVRPPEADRPGGGMKGVKGPALSSAGAPWFTVDDIFSLALVGAYRTTAPDNGGLAWHFVSNYCPRSRGRSFLFRRSDCSSTKRDNALFYSALFLFCFACLRFFFIAFIFRQPLALCCAVAGRRRVSAWISRLSWHRFIIAITPGIVARTIF